MQSSGGRHGRQAFSPRVLAWCGGGQGKASHQLSGSPLTSQPILTVGRDSSPRVCAVDISAVTIWFQSAVDPSMHLEYFQKLSMSKLYLMESMHSK